MSDDLSWLLHPTPLVVTGMGLKEQVGGAIDVVSKDIVSPLQFDPVPSDEHSCSHEIFFELVHTIDNNSVDSAPVSVSNRRELHPRSMRGVSQRDMT